MEMEKEIATVSGDVGIWQEQSAHLMYDFRRQMNSFLLKLRYVSTNKKGNYNRVVSLSRDDS